MQGKLIESIMEGYYQAHPQGEELLKLDLAEYKRQVIDAVKEDIDWHLDEISDIKVATDYPDIQLKENSTETPVIEIEKEQVMEKTLFTEALLSALIRKQPKDILAVLLEIDGKPEVAETVRAAGRFTKALVDRSVTLEPCCEEEKFEEPLPEFAEAAVEDVQEVVTVADIKALVESGKKKHLKAAKKAFKAQFSKEHPNYKELKQLIKEA